MHIVYNALRPDKATQGNDQQTELQLRIDAYKLACEKHSKDIAAIQRYMPGWQPNFYYNPYSKTI